MNAITPIHTTVAPTDPSRPLVRIVIVGHVDHGKSTLIGRLLHETNSLPTGKLEHIKAVSARRGMPFEWSFVLDALQAERDQNITIDTSQIQFRTRARDFVLIDAPGHAEFLRNMITGAAQADAAVLVVDAVEGVREQTRRHGTLLQLLGIRQIIVVINKMDRVAYDAARFFEIETDIRNYLDEMGLKPTEVIPLSARDGVGITEHTYTAEWYRPTLVQALDRLTPSRSASDQALRLPVQGVYRMDDRRIIAGRIESGRLSVGDEIVVRPSGAKSRVRSIESWPVVSDLGAHGVSAGQSIGITLQDPLFVERGHLLSHAQDPARPAQRIRVRLFWLHERPLDVGTKVQAGIGTASVGATVTAVLKSIDPGEIAPTEHASIRRNHVGEIDLTLDRATGCDNHADNAATGRVVFEFGGRIAGGGLILDTFVGPSVLPHSAPAVQSLERVADQLAVEATHCSPAERLRRLRDQVEGRIVFTTSFGLEDQAILHWIAEQALDIDVVTLDTGRLFPETYELWAATEKRYGRRIRALYPDHIALEALVARQGINGFYASKQARVSCCQVRKVEPLQRALAGAAGWVTGLRADQSLDRSSTGVAQYDRTHAVLKFNPLFDWTRDRVAAFAARESVPLNPLHGDGFVSIGCAPCTRAVAAGASERSGRWWWEQDGASECGIHQSKAN